MNDLSGLRILVTGAGGGLGKFLARQLGAVGMTRANAAAVLDSREDFDVVIHCAFSRAKDVDSVNSAGYFEDTVGLATRVLALRCRTFVLASTISVYPPDWRDSVEETPIPLDAVQSTYGLLKLLCEGLFLARGDAVILRLASLLGPFSPPNVTARILGGGAVSVPLQAQSVFNYVRYEDVEGVIRHCLASGIRGIFNVASSEAVALEEVAAMAGTDMTYGPILYRAAMVNNAKAVHIVPSLGLASREQIRQYLNDGRGDVLGSLTRISRADRACR